MPLWIRDIRFFILFAALMRLVNITSPPVEVGHNWRQSTGLMVARNFVEEKLDVFHPRVDMAGQLSGITGMEFPLLNAAHAAVSKVFGYEHWYGRLIVLLLSSWAMWSLYCLLKGVQNERMSRATIVVLTASLWFGYSRKIMPDVFSCSLVILGVHAFAQGWQSHLKRQWIAWSALGALAITAGLLSKLPSGILLAGFLPFLPVISGHWKCKLSLILLLPGILGVLWWYFLWSPALVENYGFWHFFMGKSASEGWVELMNQPGVWAKHFYDHSLKFVGFAAFLFGFCVAVRKRQFRLIASLALAFVAMTAVAMKAGDTFVQHDYYVLPFVPFMALLAGYGALSLPKRWMQYAILTIIFIEGVSNQAHDFFPSHHQRAILKLEADLDAFCDRDALVVINSGQNPAPLYFAHRKGWVMTGEEIETNRTMLQDSGAEIIVWLQKSWQTGIPNESWRQDPIDAERPWRIERLKDQ